VGAAAELSEAAPPVIRSHARRRRRSKPVWSRLSAFSVGFGGEGLLPLPRAHILASPSSPNAVPSEVSSSFKEDASSAPLSPYLPTPESRGLPMPLSSPAPSQVLRLHDLLPRSMRSPAPLPAPIWRPLGARLLPNPRHRPPSKP
jgi:hypothetical protein